MASIHSIATKTEQTIYLDTAELASLIRGDLKRAFPGVAFQVRTSRYSMGSSVNIRWTDGPIASDVDAVVARYKAEGFDGMTDSRTNSGPVRLDDGRLVDIGSFVFTQRSVSDALRARVADWLDRRFSGSGYERDYEIHRRSWRAQVVNNCLLVRKAE